MQSMIRWSTLLVLTTLLGACSSSGGNVSPGLLSNTSQASAYQAGLRAPRGLRGPRGPRPYGEGGLRPMAEPQRRADQSGRSSLSYSPKAGSGSIRLDRTALSYDNSTRTITIGSGLPQGRVPHATPQRTPQPTVYYDPITDTWTWR